MWWKRKTEDRIKVLHNILIEFAIDKYYGKTFRTIENGKQITFVVHGISIGDDGLNLIVYDDAHRLFGKSFKLKNCMPCAESQQY